MEPTLSIDEQESLLELAFQAVKATAEGEDLPHIDLEQLPDRLRHPAATFVTLSRDGALRGCIGTTQVTHPLAQDVVMRAQSAASLDPRFPAITPDELTDLDIEISLLTTPQPLSFSDPDELLKALGDECYGVILKRGIHRATFLPQVWDRVPDAQTFLELLCQKASLHRDAWKSGEVEVEIYRVESFHRKPASSTAAS